MGLCLSVALWKDKVYADRRRRALRRGREDAIVRDAMMGGGVSGYGLPMAVGALKAEEAAAPRPSGVLERAGTGTPARPIWQRRVLMGVKCQLPRFSGMMLYDERGRQVCGGVWDRARDQVIHRIDPYMLYIPVMISSCIINHVCTELMCGWFLSAGEACGGY
jgi:hypothetical protein